MTCSSLFHRPKKVIAPILPVANSETSRGRKQTVELSEVVKSILYSRSSSCAWELLPHDFPAALTVYGDLPKMAGVLESDNRFTLAHKLMYANKRDET